MSEFTVSQWLCDYSEKAKVGIFFQIGKTNEKRQGQKMFLKQF